MPDPAASFPTPVARVVTYRGAARTAQESRCVPDQRILPASALHRGYRGGLPEGLLTRKVLMLVAVPPGVVTLTGPVVAPDGTVAVICVDELTVKSAVVPLNLTPVA